MLTVSSTIDIPVEVADGEGGEEGEDEDEPEFIEKDIKVVKIRGSSYNNKIITSFIKKLEDSYYLDEVKLNFTEKEIINDIFITYNFEIVSRLRRR